MAKSVDQSSILTLGELIAKQIGRTENDVLARWMSFRLAELLEDYRTTTGSKRERVAKEAEALILRLWKSRRTWPQGDPIEKAIQLADKIIASTQPGLAKPDSGLFGLDAELEKFYEQESDLCFDATLASFDIDAERTHLSNSGALSAKEEKVLRVLVDRYDRIREKPRTINGKTMRLIGVTEEDRAANVNEIFKEIGRQRRASIKNHLARKSKIDAAAAESKNSDDL